MSHGRVQFIDPRDAGPRLRDLPQPVFAPEAVARADDALKTMGESAQPWLDADLARLQQARLFAEGAGWEAPALEPLAGAAHDLRGMGATYGFPLASQLAASLCHLVETDAGKAAVRRDPALAIAHVEALRAIVRDGVRTDQDAIGRAVLRELEMRVARLRVAPR